MGQVRKSIRFNEEDYKELRIRAIKRDTTINGYIVYLMRVEDIYKAEGCERERATK